MTKFSPSIMTLPNAKTIKQLRLAAESGLLSEFEFKILICPTAFHPGMSDEDYDAISSQASELEGSNEDPEETIVKGFIGDIAAEKKTKKKSTRK